MNLVVLMGRLTKDPEIRWTSGDNSMCIASFTLAVDRWKEGADFITCKVLGKQAENVERLLKKGTKIVLRGRWQTGSFKNKDGKTVYTNDCMVDQWKFCESKKDATEAAPDDFMSVPDGIEEELPFAN